MVQVVSGPPTSRAQAPASLAAGAVAAQPFLVEVKPSTAARPVEVLAPAAVVTARLVLRALTPADREGFTELLARSRGHVRGRINVHQGMETDDATFVRLHASTEAGDARGTHWRRGVFLRSGQPVGMVHILNIQRGLEHKGDTGWWVGPAYCGNGIASEAVAAMVHHALRDLPTGLGLHALSAAVSAENIASARVAERAGFVRVAGAVSHVVINGVHEAHGVWEARARL
jgi:ribosomal-protein-alanine N-acetyltransferase